MREDRFLKYLETYYQEHKTINDIQRYAIVIFEGEPLKIGEFLASIRKQHRLYINGDKSRGSMSETSLNRYKILDSYGFEWEPRKKNQKELEENDVCMIFIEKYYEKHQTLDSIPESFTIDGVEYSIRNFFAHIRVNHKKYLSGENSKGSDSPTALRRYASLDNMNFDWEPLETKKAEYAEDDKYISFLEMYYQERKTLVGVPKTAIYNGEELNIESFLSDRRSKHKENLTNPDYLPSELELTRWAKLDEMAFDWTPRETEHQDKMANDKYIRYLRLHYEKHKTINDIKAKQEVEFEGEILKIGDFLNDMRKKHLAYIEKKEGVVGIDTELMLKRYRELEEMELDWRPSESAVSIAKIARANGLKTNKLRRYVERFNGDIEKALKICKGGAKYKKVVHKKAKGIAPNLTTIAQEFEIDMATLTSLLNKPALHVRQPKQVLMYDKDTNLRQYCLDNGLNYTVIQKAIKLRMKGLSDEDLQSLINRCICEYKTHGQQRPSTWIYSKYGNEALVTHLLTYLKLDAEAVLYDMSTNCIDIYQAMENNSFQRSSKQQYDYLEFIYRNAVKFYKAACNAKHDRDTTYELTESHLEDLVREYNLTEEETSIIRESLDRYTNAVEQYHLFNVGFEKDPDKRVEKIILYSLDEDEIEEAFFMPLKFDQKALIGRDSEVYKRRVILKNITVSWSYLSEEERKAKVDHYQLTPEELDFVTATRKEIDATKQKVFTK